MVALSAHRRRCMPLWLCGVAAVGAVLGAAALASLAVAFEGGLRRSSVAGGTAGDTGSSGSARGFGVP